ncbi:MAG: Ig-like domain repeat protein, partial [Deltaproteobacteria bacterium]|nr:Ig-like domain repeat protein [Deltaproteobacteria bacterium]
MVRHPRFLLYLAVCGLILAAPAQAGLKFYQATTVSLMLSDNPLPAGQPLTLTAVVRDDRGVPVAAGLVQIQLAEAPEGPWMKLEEGPPDAVGCFRLTDHTLGLEAGSFYVRAWYSGADTSSMCYAPGVSPALPLVITSPTEQEEALLLGFVAASGNGAPRLGEGGP